MYFDTTHYIGDKQLTKDLKIKDQFIISIINRTLDDYRKSASELECRLELFDAQSFKQYLLKKDEKINFLIFCQYKIDKLKEEGRTKSASNYNTVRNSLLDFLEWKPVLLIEQITLGFIGSYEKYLRSKRTIYRKNQFGISYGIKTNGLTDSSIHNYLRDFKGLFGAAMSSYNKPSLGLRPITYNPFGEYKIVDSTETKKRNLDIEQIKLIRDCNVKEGSRAKLAKDLFMLSFYLCGINAIDLYNNKFTITDNRFEYNRSKTKGKRKDKAFISIKIPPEATDLITKYLAYISSKYASIGNLNAALSEGMKDICKITKISGITYYWARHSFANIARNKCRVSKDDVALVLNHVDSGRKTTDIYIEKDWSIIDEVQELVLNLLRLKKSCQPYEPLNNTRSILGSIQLPRLI